MRRWWRAPGHVFSLELLADSAVARRQNSVTAPPDALEQLLLVERLLLVL